MARAAVHSYPYYPDCLAIAHVIAEQQQQHGGPSGRPSSGGTASSAGKMHDGGGGVDHKGLLKMETE